jgi:DNA processing protein
VENARDILEELQIPAPAPAVPPPAAATDARTERLLEALGDEVLDRDTLAARCRLQPAELAALLTQLEIDGDVATLPGGLIQRVRR